MRWVAGLGDAGETAAVITTLVVITAFVAVGLRKGIFGRSSDAQVPAALALLVASVPFLSNGSLVSATVRYRGMVVQFVIATVTLVIVVLVSANSPPDGVVNSYTLLACLVAKREWISGSPLFLLNYTVLPIRAA